MVGNTSFVGRRCSIMAAHKIKQPSDGADVYRFQGVALAKNMLLNHFAFSILEKRAAKLVRKCNCVLQVGPSRLIGGLTLICQVPTSCPLAQLKLMDFLVNDPPLSLLKIVVIFLA